MNEKPQLPGIFKSAFFWEIVFIVGLCVVFGKPIIGTLMSMAFWTVALVVGGVIFLLVISWFLQQASKPPKDRGRDF